MFRCYLVWFPLKAKTFILLVIILEKERREVSSLGSYESDSLPPIEKKKMGENMLIINVSLEQCANSSWGFRIIANILCHVIAEPCEPGIQLIGRKDQLDDS